MLTFLGMSKGQGSEFLAAFHLLYSSSGPQNTVLTPVLQILINYEGEYEGDIKSKLKISFQAKNSSLPSIQNFNKICIFFIHLI